MSTSDSPAASATTPSSSSLSSGTSTFFQKKSYPSLIKQQAPQPPHKVTVVMPPHMQDKSPTLPPQQPRPPVINATGPRTKGQGAHNPVYGGVQVTPLSNTPPARPSKVPTPPVEPAKDNGGEEDPSVLTLSYSTANLNEDEDMEIESSGSLPPHSEEEDEAEKKKPTCKSAQPRKSPQGKASRRGVAPPSL